MILLGRCNVDWLWSTLAIRWRLPCRLFAFRTCHQYGAAGRGTAIGIV